jgi:hypothetical protein
VSDAIERLVQAGEQVGFTGHGLVCMLKGGMSLETLSDLIEVRMTYLHAGPRRLSRLEMKRFPLYLRIQSARGQFTSAALHSRSSPANIMMREANARLPKGCHVTAASPGLSAA